MFWADACDMVLEFVPLYGTRKGVLDVVDCGQAGEENQPTVPRTAVLKPADRWPNGMTVGTETACQIPRFL